MGRHVFQNQVLLIRLNQMFESKREFDRLVFERSGETYQSTRKSRSIALFVEMGESLQELQHLWKFWKQNHKVVQFQMMDELADVLHFIISIGVDLDVDPIHDAMIKHTDVMDQIEALIRRTPFTNDGSFDWWNTLALYRGLLDHLNIDWPTIQKQYWRKDRVNIDRQKRDY